MKLYYAPRACSLAVHIVAREAGIPLDLVRVDLVNHRTETGVNLAEINPKNSVPAIQLEDGSSSPRPRPWCSGSPSARPRRG